MAWAQAEKDDPKRAGRARKAVEALVATELATHAEYADIDAMVKRAYANYEKALREALRSPQDDSKLWHRVLEAQQAAINTSTRRRALERHLG